MSWAATSPRATSSSGATSASPAFEPGNAGLANDPTCAEVARQAVIDTLGEQGIAVRADYVLGSDYYIASAYEAAARLIETDATAVFASSDNIALGLLKRLYAHDLRVPRDYSVVSYDNSAADVLFEPALTSIEQNVPELSQAALDLLFRRIAESEAGELRGPDEVVLDPKLVLKDSVRRLD